MGSNASRENIGKPKPVPWEILDDLHSDFDPTEYVADIQRKKKCRNSNNLGIAKNRVPTSLPKEYHKMGKDRNTKRRGVARHFDSDSDSNTSYSRTIQTITVDLSKEDDDYCSNTLPPKIIYSPREYSPAIQNYTNEDHVSNRQGSRKNKTKSIVKRNEWGESDNIQNMVSDLNGSQSIEQVPNSSRRKPPKSRIRQGVAELYFSRPKLRFASSSASSTLSCHGVSSFPGSEETTHNRMFQRFEESERQLKRSLL